MIVLDLSFKINGTKKIGFKYHYTDFVGGLPSTGFPGLSLYLSAISTTFSDLARSKLAAVSGSPIAKDGRRRNVMKAVPNLFIV